MIIIVLVSLVAVSAVATVYGIFRQRTGDTVSIDQVVAEDMEHTHFMEELVFPVHPID